MLDYCVQCKIVFLFIPLLKEFRVKYLSIFPACLGIHVNIWALKNHLVTYRALICSNSAVMEVMDGEAHPLGLTINWAKTKIQNLGDLDGVHPMHYATVQGNQVEVVESFTYLWSLIHCSGSSEPEIKRRVNIVCEAMSVLDQNIWRSCITLETKLHLYNACVLPIFLYGAETWSSLVDDLDIIEED